MADFMQVRLDDLAIEALLSDADGPVGRYMYAVSQRMAIIAKSAAPVMKGKNYWTARSNAVRPAGTTRASVHSVFGYDDVGQPFAGVNALANPSIFLEKPASQMHRRYPFLTLALDPMVL